MHQRFGHLDLGPEDLEDAVGPDQPDELDLAAARQRGRQLDLEIEEAPLEARSAFQFAMRSCP